MASFAEIQRTGKVFAFPLMLACSSTRQSDDAPIDAVVHLRACDTVSREADTIPSRVPSAIAVPTRGILVGAVVELRSKAALQDVRVRLEAVDSAAVLTNGRGGFRLVAPSGHYLLTAARVGFVVARIAVALHAGRIDTAVVPLEVHACP